MMHRYTISAKAWARTSDAASFLAQTARDRNRFGYATAGAPALPAAIADAHGVAGAVVAVTVVGIHDWLHLERPRRRSNNGIRSFHPRATRLLASAKLRALTLSIDIRHQLRSAGDRSLALACNAAASLVSPQNPSGVAVPRAWRCAAGVRSCRATKTYRCAV
jgi:hypothetical protein